jgi:hypothetical protein
VPGRSVGVVSRARIFPARLSRGTPSPAVPAITIAGVVGALCVAALVICALTLDELALTDAGSRAVIVAACAGGAIFFYGRRVAHRVHGIDTSFALREVPPE